MTCEFNHEGFCILQNEYPEIHRCERAEGKLQVCTAKDSDLIELCPECDKPVSECDCGTCLVLVEDLKGNIGLLTQRKFHEIAEGLRGKETPP